MPNLRGASPVGRGVGDRAYAACAFNRGKSNRRSQGRGKLPNSMRGTVISGGSPWDCSREMGLDTQVPPVNSRMWGVADGKSSSTDRPRAEGGRGRNSYQVVTAWCRRVQSRGESKRVTPGRPAG